MSPLLLLLLGLLTLILCVLRGRNRELGQQQDVLSPSSENKQLSGGNKRDDEPPLIKGWIPFIGKALEFGRDAYKFLEEHKKTFGDVFTVHIAGKYMTFIMDPLMYPNIIKHGRQLDFHKFSDKVAPLAFGYPPVMDRKSPGLHTDIQRSFQLLQGDNLKALTESMMGNLMLVLRQDHLDERPAGEEGGWRSGSMYDFCNSVMFEATFLTIYGRPEAARRHGEMGALRENFVRFDTMFPLLVAQVPIRLLRQAKASRDTMIDFFLPHKVSCWSNTSRFIRRRMELLDQYTLRDVDKAGHHFAILWASVANTVPASFWSLYHLVSHPEALEVVRQEILDVLNQDGVEFSRDRDVTISRDQLDRLLYLESTINESLRLSSASMNIRVVEEDFSLRVDGERSVAVRKGDIIVLYPQSLHMDPEIYEEPQTFKPDRYIQDGRERTDFYKDGQKLKYYLMPFGSGSTMCPGRYFAINEIKQFLCLLLLYFDLQLEDGQTRATVDTSRAGLGILLPTADVRFRYRLRTV